MNVGLDIGYSAVKVINCGDPGKWRTFPSAVGTPDKPRFSLDDNASIILVSPEHVQVGEGAITQSQFLNRREDRHWIESAEWYNLFLAALTEVAPASYYDSGVRIVTGLPVAFYGDKTLVRDRLLGEHRPQREEHKAQVFQVVAVNVIPQPFGALLAASLDDSGRIVDQIIAMGAIGVIDVGGKTSNLLSVNRLSEISRETASVSAGAWDAVRALRNWMADHCPDLELRDHQVIDAIIARRVNYYGEPIDLTSAVDAILAPLADQVLAAATQLWNGAAALDAILVSGGGALLLGPYIKTHFRHARVVDEPVYANALGFWRFCQRLARGK